MAKVAAVSDGSRPETFPAPHGTNLIAYPPEFLKAMERVGKHYCTLPDGRKICYFKDGTQGDPLLITFHGGCEGKYKFIQKEPIPGVFLVSIDRPGYGESDPAPSSYTFRDAANDIVFLAKELDYDEFCVGGHSIGGGWAAQMAAGIPDHVRGAILISSVCDLSHPKAKPFASSVGRPPACCHPTKGCCGCVLKSEFTKYAKLFQKYNFKSSLAEEQKKGPAGFEAYKADDFWIASTVESWLAFTPPGAGILTDAQMVLFAGSQGKPIGHFDVASTRCPVHVIHGDKDFDMGTKAPGAIDYYKMMYPDATFDILENYAHVMTVSPNKDFQDRVLKAMAKMGPIKKTPAQQEMAN